METQELSRRQEALVALYKIIEDPMFENPLFDVDFYKFGHVRQYPKGTKQIWSNWTPRSCRLPDQKHTVWFGGQYYYKKKLMYAWDKYFFSRPEAVVIKEYIDFIRATLNIKEPYVSHIQRLHRTGYLPIDIYALPEGVPVPLGIPPLVITNTQEHAFWLPNCLESDMSNMMWKASTSASTAQRFRKMLTKWAIEAGEKDLSFINWQAHDFSYRGMSGKDDAILSGMGHLLNFSGTDTCPAILKAMQYYGASLDVGGSVNATEHSVMCAGGNENEFETFERLIFEVYPEGILSIVSDTWDLWRVITDYMPRLKDRILLRDGKIVLRPDSGDPVKIVTGNTDYIDVPNSRYPMVLDHHPAFYGAMDLLAKAMGTSAGAGRLPMINKAGLIYGDAITEERGNAILDRIVNNQKLSPFNMVFGVGSFTYEFTTRDQYGWAMKATAVRDVNDLLQAIFKDPVTDYDVAGKSASFKKSAKGIPAVYRTEGSTEEKPIYFMKQESFPEALDKCAFQKVFSNGELLVDEKFPIIRERARA